MSASRHPVPAELDRTLTPAQRESVLTATAHLHALQAHALQRSLAWWLRGRGSCGDGELHRLLASLMREQLTSPSENGRPGPELEARPRRRGTSFAG
jgi:hypothetical protein